MRRVGKGKKAGKCKWDGSGKERKLESVNEMGLERKEYWNV